MEGFAANRRDGRINLSLINSPDSVLQSYMKNVRRKYKHCEDGFSYIDVMIAIVILIVGVLAMASTLTANLVRSLDTEKRMIAKQAAVSTIESIISARDIERPNGLKGWNAVGNKDNNLVGGVPQGIFLNGWCPIRQDLGLDGVAGTDDDACPANSICDNSAGAPNNSPVLKGYERQIVITDVPDSERPTPPYAVFRRRIDVTIRFFSNQSLRQEVVSTIITDYQGNN